MQSYTPTDYRLRNREPYIALGSHQGGVLNFCVRGTSPRGKGSAAFQTLNGNVVVAFLYAGPDAYEVFTAALQKTGSGHIAAQLESTDVGESVLVLSIFWLSLFYEVMFPFVSPFFFSFRLLLLSLFFLFFFFFRAMRKKSFL